MRRLVEGLRSAGVTLPPVYCCPHTSQCGCVYRKPARGFAERAPGEHGLDLARSAVIGDSGADDMLLARAIGAKAVLVLTGWGRGSLSEFRCLWAHTEAGLVAEDLLQGVRWARAQF
jgi:D-glycero-D-manno-heptose 1,7-bisphosphate phosphatase